MDAGAALAELYDPEGFGVVALSPDGTRMLISRPDRVRLVAVPK